MAEGTDHYTTLGLTPSATAAQIKAAYHHRAKAAHPDAGGSAEEMARVNEAYQALIDPASRHAYDGRHAEDPHPHHAAEESRSQAHRTPADHAAEREEHEEATRVNRERAAWARDSAWEMARFSAPAAIGAIVISRFFTLRPSSMSTRLTINFLAFIPVYALVLSLIFLMSPALRLVFADLVRHHRTTKHERISALALVLAFFPLAIIWIFVFSRT